MWKWKKTCIQNVEKMCLRTAKIYFPLCAYRSKLILIIKYTVFGWWCWFFCISGKQRTQSLTPPHIQRNKNKRYVNVNGGRLRTLDQIGWGNKSNDRSLHVHGSSSSSSLARTPKPRFRVSSLSRIKVVIFLSQPRRKISSAFILRHHHHHRRRHGNMGRCSSGVAVVSFFLRETLQIERISRASELSSMN